MFIRRFYWLPIAALVVFIDQWSKLILNKKLPLYGSIKLLPFFSLTLIYNKGVAFGMMSDMGNWHNYLIILFDILAEL